MAWNTPDRETLRAYVMEAARRADEDGRSLSSHMREDFNWPPVIPVETEPQPPHNLRTTPAIDKPPPAPTPSAATPPPPLKPQPQRRGADL